MSDSIRETIIKKFISLAAGIRTASGYNTNIGASVKRAEPQIDQTALPASNIVPSHEVGLSAGDTYDSDLMRMTIQAEGLVAHGSTDASVMYEMILADLRKCFTCKQHDIATVFGNIGIDSVYYRGTAEPYLKSVGAEVTGAAISLQVTYRTAMGDPYN